MDLKSLEFAAFVVLFLIAYFAVYKIQNAQKYVILLANIIFICFSSGVRSLLLILLLCIFHFFCGRAIEKAITDNKKSHAHLAMWVGVVFAIVVLCYFKFFTGTYELLRTSLQQKGFIISELITPIGISYYTLSMIAYNIDIYHKKHEAEHNFIDFVVFITFFPSIVQGPINLYKKTAYQFKTNHGVSYDRIIKGLQRCLWGYIKKAVIADRIGIIVIDILKDDGSAGFLLIWAMILYSFQIYADFSGGIDVIMGIAEMMDISLTENFKSPLISQSVTEYWQRWHISLGEFMEKYIYYPIVLNRKVMKFSKRINNKYLQKSFSATFAAIIVFVIVGIWHGTGWNYVAYGCYQALFVSSAVLLMPVYKKSKECLHINENCLSWRLFGIIRTFFILVVGRFFIRASSLTSAIDLLKRAFGRFELSGLHVLFDGSLDNYGLDYKNRTVMYIGIFALIVVDIIHLRGFRLREWIMKQDIAFRYFVYFIALFSFIIFGVYGVEFDSSSFIYQGF